MNDRVPQAESQRDPDLTDEVVLARYRNERTWITLSTAKALYKLDKQFANLSDPRSRRD